MSRIKRLLPTTVVGILGAVFLLQGQSTTTSFRFVSWADTKTDTDVLSRLSDQVTALSNPPVFTIYPGDLVDSGFDQTRMDLWKRALNGELTGSSTSNGMFNKTFAVRGNHDSSDAAGWQNFFDFAKVASDVGANSGSYESMTTDLVYSFDYKNARIIGLDALGNAQKLSSSQVIWLDGQLAEAERLGLTHAFIFFHGPIYCLDGHAARTRHASTKEMMDRSPTSSTTIRS